MIRRYASAGAVVTTNDLGAPSILLLDQVRGNGERQTVAPKGRLEPSEAPLQAAVREVAEETGLTGTHYGAYLGQEKYVFTDNDGSPAAKTVDWFLFATATTAATPARDEGFVQARWLDAPAARRAATHIEFQRILDRALAIIAWRSAGPLPFSRSLSQLITEVATEAQAAIAGHPEAGVGLCGSAARGDFIDGWSDVNFVAWNLPATSRTATKINEIVAEASKLHGIRASLHLTGEHAGNVRSLGALHDMTMRMVLDRVGLDTAVIAGAGPTHTTTPAATNLAEDIAALHHIAVSGLSARHDSSTQREDATRHVLSVLSCAARLLIVQRQPKAPLRLPEVAEALRHWPDKQLTNLLCDYDAFRRTVTLTVNQAEQLAARVPAALIEAAGNHREPAWPAERTGIRRRTGTSEGPDGHVEG
ncbi:NUDIX domain-containing protein [Micromonospora hortensis]|uniref:NUDIX domain-containing protein n=1 Tax=Micromonospora hortensis TaxID=2911209 RepID=UPI001EE7DF9B|nr:NUDIX domain-containing protein [Micromonospora hortensis]MCG5450974.1 NUDIX domain-containing protein [Micromonospora hortensis]